VAFFRFILLAVWQIIQGQAAPLPSIRFQCDGELAYGSASPGQKSRRIQATRTGVPSDGLARVEARGPCPNDGDGSAVA
jgi:hypothetical protein